MAGIGDVVARIISGLVATQTSTLNKTCYYHLQLHAWFVNYMKNFSQLLALIIGSTFLLSCGSEDGAKRIVLGTSNILYATNSLQYSKPFVVQVTRDAEHPAPGAVVDISIRPLRYFKGGYMPVDTDADFINDTWSLNQTVGCPAEDINNNSIREPGEDINNNLRLDPTYPGTVDVHPDLLPTITPGIGRIITNSNGFGYFTVTYPQSEASWTEIEITVKANVTGTEETEYSVFILPVLVDELAYDPAIPVAPPGGSTSRYGSSFVCTDAL